MIRTKLAKKVLTKKEQRHLTDSGINSMRAMKEQIEYMRKLNPKSPGHVCWDCWFIGKN